MCESKPAPRCDLHSYQDRSKALASLTAFQKEYDRIEKPTDKQTRELNRKKDIYTKRDWEFSVACANKAVFTRSTKTVEETEKVVTADEKISRSRLVVERVKELKDKKEWEKARREFVIRKALHTYLNGIPLAKAFVGANDRRNRNLIIDAFELLTSLPSNLGGRPLTAYELKVVNDAKNSPVRNSPDYLPKDFTLSKPVVKKVKPTVKPKPVPVKSVLPTITRPKVLGKPLPPIIKVPTGALKPATLLPVPIPVKVTPPFPGLNKPVFVPKPSTPSVVLPPRRGGTPLQTVEVKKAKGNVLEWLKGR